MRGWQGSPRARRWAVLAACMAVSASIAATAFAQETDDEDPAKKESPSTTSVPIRPRPVMPPGGAPAPDAIRKRLESIRGARTRTQRQPTGDAAATPTPTPAPAATAQPATGSSSPGTSTTSTTGNGNNRIGTGLVETNPKAAKPLPWNQKVSLAQIDDADLEEVIKTISRITARNFIYDKKDVRNQKVTILAPSPLTVGEAYQAFQTALQNAGLTLVQVGPNLVQITPRRDAKERPLDTEAGTSVPWNDSFVTRIIRLQNIDVGQIQAILQQLAAKDGQIQAFAPTNSLIITDTANNIRRLAKIIDELDRSGGEETIEVIRVKNANVADVADKIQQLFGGTAGGAPGQPAARRPSVPIRRGRKAATPVQAGVTGESAPMVSKVIPDERTNQLIIQGNERAIQEVREFLELIDISEEGGGGIHVYYLENADAEQLAGVLSNLAQGVAAGGQAGRNRGRIEAPAPGGNGAGGVAVLEGDVKITADVATNALVITASKSDFLALTEVIKKLDIRRQQVFVEAVIMEITVNKARELGLSFGGAADVGDGAVGFGGLNAGNALFINPTQLATGFALGLLGPGGVTLSVPNPTGGTTDVTVPPFGVVLNALQTDSDINVLSRPTVLATENEESEIIVATSVAVPGNVTISQTGLQNFSITREDVGITLRVTPKINESEYVSMQLFQEVKDIINDQTTASGQRLIDTGKRSAKTNVVVKNGETIVIGGLLSDTDRRGERKIPLLGDIPFLGWLFRSTTRSATKQNLLIFLTPTIINDDGDMREIYERRIREREEFLRLYASRQARKEEKKRRTVYDHFYSASREKPEETEDEPAVKPVFEPVNRPIDAVPEDESEPTPDDPATEDAQPGEDVESEDAGESGGGEEGDAEMSARPEDEADAVASSGGAEQPEAEAPAQE